jgi:hypothetical protein
MIRINCVGRLREEGQDFGDRPMVMSRAVGTMSQYQLQALLPCLEAKVVIRVQRPQQRRGGHTER